jgi:hypothetical protein
LKPLKKARNGRAKRLVLLPFWCGLNNNAHSAGLSVKDTSREIIVAVAIVTAN